MKGLMHKMIKESARTAEDFFHENAETLEEVIRLLVDTFRRGRKLLVFGNGGSAADAQHLVAEFINRVRLTRRALPAIALTTDTSTLTSIANDTGYEKIFSRQVEALGKVDDVALGISTSGNSMNVVEGVIAARRLGMITICLTGGDGGLLARECDHRLIVPSGQTPRIQESHYLACHIISELVEQEMARQPDLA
jgi:D-sedoheptulose 7-phosphate isomerase